MELLKICFSEVMKGFCFSSTAAVQKIFTKLTIKDFNFLLHDMIIDFLEEENNEG